MTRKSLGKILNTTELGPSLIYINNDSMQVIYISVHAYILCKYYFRFSAVKRLNKSMKFA